MSYSKEEIYLNAKNILINLFELEESELMLEAKLQEDLDIDSIDAVDLIIELQNFTGKKIDPEHFKEVKTLQDIVDVIYEVQD